MATLHWDHTVHYVNDIEKAIDIFYSNGLHAFYGGSHTQWGTNNGLCYFGLNYLEFLGVENAELIRSMKEPNQLVKDSLKWLPEHERLSRVAIRTDDIESTVDLLQKYHLDHSPIMDGKRRNAQGQLMKWKMVTVAGEFQGLDYPFFLQWSARDEERYKNLQESGAIARHPAGDLDVKEAVFQVEKPIEVAKHWQKFLGLFTLDHDKSKNEARLTIDNKQFVFQEGPANGLSEIILATESPRLKGKTIELGEGKYTFK